MNRFCILTSFHQPAKSRFINEKFLFKNFIINAFEEILVTLTDSQIKSGEAAYLLGSDWGQIITKDPRPVVNGKKYINIQTDIQTEN